MTEITQDNPISASAQTPQTPHNAQGAVDPNTQAFKIEPHSLEAEQAVLGGLMLSSTAWDRIVDQLSEVDFFKPEHRLLFKAMNALALNDQPIDVLTVSEYLGQRDALEQVGGLAYLGDLANNTPSSANIVAYAKIVREKSILRQLIKASTHISESAFVPKGRKARDILDKAEQEIFAIAEQGEQKNSGPQGIAEVLTRTLERVETLFESGSTVTGQPNRF